MTEQNHALKDFIRDAMLGSDDEMPCEESFDLLDCFVEKVLAGADVASEMPKLKAHLDHCPACREEFEALLRAVQAGD
jgi:hypothetical protein